MYFLKVYNPTRTEQLAKFSRYISLDFSDKLNQPSDATIKLTTEDYEANLDVFEKYNRVSIFNGETEKWRGYIGDIKNADTVVTIYMYSMWAFLKKRFITKKYASQNTNLTFADVIETMNQEFPTEFIYGGTDLAGTNEEFDFSNTQIFEALKSIASSQSAEIQITYDAENSVPESKVYYKFEDVGSEAIDSSGNHNTGTLVNLNRVDANFGRAVSFSGNNDAEYLISKREAVDKLEDFAFIARITLVRGISITPCLFSCANSSQNNEFLTMYNDTLNRWQIYIKGSLYYINSTFPSDGLDHLIVFQRTGNTLKVFIDEEQIDGDITVTDQALDVDLGGFIIGQDQDTVGGGFQASQSWSGLVGDVRVFDRGLTQQEIIDISRRIDILTKTRIWLLSQVGEDKSDETQANSVVFKYIEDRMNETNIEKPDYSEEGGEMANYIIAQNDQPNEEKKTSIVSDIEAGKDRIEAVVTFPNIISQDALDEAALDYLNKHKNPRKNPVLDPIFNKLDESLYSVGDLCKIRLKYGFVDLDVNYRIVSKDYEVINGGEDVKVRVETSNTSLSRENFFERIASMEKRIADLQK